MKNNRMETGYFSSSFLSGTNSAMSLSVNPSPKIFNILFNVWVVTDLFFFNLGSAGLTPGPPRSQTKYICSPAF